MNEETFRFGAHALLLKNKTQFNDLFLLYDAVSTKCQNLKNQKK